MHVHIIRPPAPFHASAAAARWQIAPLQPVTTMLVTSNATPASYSTSTTISVFLAQQEAPPPL